MLFFSHFIISAVKLLILLTQTEGYAEFSIFVLDNIMIVKGYGVWYGAKQGQSGVCGERYDERQ